MSVKHFFEEGGELEKALPRYRKRQAQIDASEFIYSSMESRVPAVLEAPTGSGKTMAYLVPSFELNRRIIISTKTKQLMSQIAGKDINSARRIFGDDKYVAVLKGRKNYFCHFRFFKLMYPHPGRYEKVMEWYESVARQEIIEMPVGLFNMAEIENMTTDSWMCTASKCEFYDICSFYRAKQNANDADIVITNHYLLMSDFALKAESEHASIFDFADHIIMDEAHSIPDIFPRFAGTELSLRSFLRVMNENRPVFDPREIEITAGMLSGLLEDITERRYTSEIKDRLISYIEFANKSIGEKDVDDLKQISKRLNDKAESVLGGSEGVRFVDTERGDIVLQYIPFDASEKLREGLKNSCLSPVFVSATLSVKGSFEYFLNETGYAEDEVQAKSLEPVFNMGEQGRLMVRDCDDAFYEELALKAKSSVLVICNSVSRMNKVTKLLKNIIPERVFAQTEIDISDTEGLTDAFFVGCAVFREGMDFAHTGISFVVLDKLPFEYFEDIVLKERAASLKNKGLDPFKDYFLPRAVIYYRQAVGRLLRHEDDHGVWAVLDSRIETKNYGKYFRDVLNNVPKIDSIDDAVRFLEVTDETD
ncbi:ATP-dependent DNA helicase [Seleniivibrio sp.]|uniref:ATP-dependent DNA helicase n=1 Tax=Seleniivibrio sp. TaxID=2898801 RepID=UPI0025F867AA|nr:ATP-dependent DNA helicase [Seleniivibrio sp.]MCD8554229.1 ATP-dependent DNA helicase [Seleniivibrio sp.]